MTEQIQQTNAIETTERNQYKLLDILDKKSVMMRLDQASGGQGGEVAINIITACNENPDLWECDPNSVINAALQATTMRLSIAKSLGQAVILPYNTKRGKKANFQPMVRGIKKLALNTNKYRFLNAFIVYEGQRMIEDQMKGMYFIEGHPTSRRVTGFGGYFALFSGYEASVWWPLEKVLDHAAKYGRSSLWDDKHLDKNQNYDGRGFTAMALKTVMRDLVLNHGVIDERDRRILEQIEDQKDGDISGNIINLEDMPDATADEPETPKHTAESAINDLYGGNAPKPPAPEATGTEYVYQDGKTVATGDQPKYIEYCKAHSGNAPKNVYNLHNWKPQAATQETLPTIPPMPEPPADEHLDAYGNPSDF